MVPMLVVNYTSVNFNIVYFMIYIITYDLSEPGQNFENLVEKIKESGSWAKLGGSAYLVDSAKSAVELRDECKKFIDSNDKLYVGQVEAPAAWSGMPQDVSNWIKDKLKKHEL